MRNSRFKVDASDGTPLSRQLAADLRLAIIRGQYKPGCALPTIEALSRESGMSFKVARRALELLAADGWTRPVRGVGSVVLDRGDGATANGRVLFYVRQTGYSYYCSAMLSVIDACLFAKGYKTFTVNASERSEGPACLRLKSLLNEKWGLVVIFGGGFEARRLAMDSLQPFLLLGTGEPPSKCTAPTCIGRLVFDKDKAVAECVSQCIRRGVKRVVQFKYDYGAFDAVAPLAEAGIQTETIGIRRESSPEAVSRAALAEMRLILAKEQRPDLFLFTDDLIAQGALIALSEADVRIPEDVAVVTLANKGLGPIWTKPLSRIEVDPVANGRAAAGAILGYLESGTPPPALCRGYVWRDGKTL